MADFKAGFSKQNTSCGPPLAHIVAVQLFLPASEWCAQTEWRLTMGSMQWSAGYNEADVWLLGEPQQAGESEGGGGHIPAFVAGVHPLPLSPLAPLPLMASRSFFLSCKHVNMHTWKHSTHTHTHTHTHTPPPLVLIIPLQIRRSISSCIIVSPLPPSSASPQLLSIQVGERSCPLSPCQPRWPRSPGSHIPSRPIGPPHRGRAQLDDSVLPEERRREEKKKKRKRKANRCD